MMKIKKPKLSRSEKSGLTLGLALSINVGLVFGFFGAVQAQTMVSTETGVRTVIMEEYTGAKCSNCPSGHKISDQIKAKHANRYAAINIHCTSLGAPYPNYPDFRTPVGEIMFREFDISGLPLGVIDRARLSEENTFEISRDLWESYIEKELNKTPIVNIAAKATIDYQKREMICEIEAYYLNDSKFKENRLNVALLQNNVLAPQQGAEQYKEMVVGGEYRHNHILRELLFGLEGDTIFKTTKGTLLTKTVKYSIPDSLHGLKFDIGNMDLVVFITESDKNILNGAVPKIMITKVPNHPIIKEVEEVQVNSCDPIGATRLKIFNRGVARIDALTCEATINGKTKTLSWVAGEKDTPAQKDHYVPAGDSSWCTFSYFETAESDTTKIRYKLTTVNSEPITVTVPQEDLIGEGTFIKKVARSKETSKLKIEMNIDQYGGEVSWKLFGSNGNTLASHVYETDLEQPAVQTFTHEVALPYADCYTFEVYDKGKDGFNNIYGEGSYKIYDEKGNIITEGDGKFTDKEYKSINIQSVSNKTDKTIDVAEIQVYPNPVKESFSVKYALNNSCSNVSISVYNMLGVKIYQTPMRSLSAGTYQSEIPSSQWVKGVYLLRLEAADKQLGNKGTTIKIQKL